MHSYGNRVYQTEIQSGGLSHYVLQWVILRKEVSANVQSLFVERVVSNSFWLSQELNLSVAREVTIWSDTSYGTLIHKK